MKQPPSPSASFEELGNDPLRVWLALSKELSLSGDTIEALRYDLDCLMRERQILRERIERCERGEGDEDIIDLLGLVRKNFEDRLFVVGMLRSELERKGGMEEALRLLDLLMQRREDE